MKRRRLNNAQYWLARLNEDDIYRKFICSFEKLFRFVEWIHQPEAPHGGDVIANAFIGFF